MNIVFGILIIIMCTLGLGYLIGYATVDRDDWVVPSKSKLFIERMVVGMQYIGYVSLVVVFVVGLIFGIGLLGAK